MTVVDAFGDRDLAESFESVSTCRDLGLPFSDEAIQVACSGIPKDMVVYGGGMENRPALVDKISEGLFLAGNTPDVLTRVRDPLLLQKICRQEGIPFPRTCSLSCADVCERQEEESLLLAGGKWLRKGCASGGGTGVQFFGGPALSEGEVMQRYLPGRAVSVSFVAHKDGAEILGMSEQLVGIAEFGATDFKWCGNIMPVFLQPPEGGKLWEAAVEYARILSSRFGLRGLNGIDMIQSDRLYVIEVNARFTASMELLDSFQDGTLFNRHLDACSGRTLRGVDLRNGFTGYRAKAVVYARQRCKAPETEVWIRRGWRDVPWPGDVFEEGSPVCTVFSEASDLGRCREFLVHEAAKVYEELVPMEGGKLRHD
ncbi:MAG: ATP-grasp domain-containing protein [Thermovirgaceae bacterium]